MYLLDLPFRDLDILRDRPDGIVNLSLTLVKALVCAGILDSSPADPKVMRGDQFTDSRTISVGHIVRLFELVNLKDCPEYILPSGHQAGSKRMQQPYLLW